MEEFDYKFQTKVMQKIYELQEINEILQETITIICEGYVRPSVYGTDIWEEAQEVGGLEKYFINKTIEERREK